MLTGASAVEISTAVMDGGFRVYSDIKKGIEAYLRMDGFNSVKEVIRFAHRK